MDLDAVDYRSTQSDVRTAPGDKDDQASLLTPARRAALDALEREFSDLLNSLPRPQA
jgi:hypothetical protein